MKSVFFLTMIVCISIFTACSDTKEGYEGYVEGDFVNISSSQSGRIEKLFVQKGDMIRAGKALFSLDTQNEEALLKSAESSLASARSTLFDMQKGSREPELAVIQEELASAIAIEHNNRIQYERTKRLFAQNAVSKEVYDDATAAFNSQSAKVRELQNSLSVAKLPSRIDRIDAQKKVLKQLEAEIASAQWKVDEKALKSPNDALVFDTLYRVGEFVPAGYPIVRLLPPQNIKIRFFVPNDVAAHLQVGKSVMLRIDSNSQRIPAHISYISTQVEYTPPVIYSNERKEKLVFMIEAYPNDTHERVLHLGEPVEVFLDDK